MRERWLSKRAIPLHVAALVVVPGCAIAAWWQVTRAADGNQLSYLYMVMWPAFGVLGIVFWWMLIHTDYDTVGLKGMRRQQAQETRGDVSASPVTAGPSTEATTVPPGTVTPVAAMSPAAPNADEDPELVAYNARLASLSAKGAKTWRNRETVVVRRAE